MVHPVYVAWKHHAIVFVVSLINFCFHLKIVKRYSHIITTYKKYFKMF